MTSLAIIAQEQGIAVTGSDTDEIFPTDATLDQYGIKPLIGFKPAHINDAVDLVVYTGAHDGIHNIEVQTAINKQIPVLAQGKALGLFMSRKRQISVAGSHGKTTTAAMIASILSHSRAEPSYAVGCGSIIDLGTPAHWDKGAWFVAEADEYVTDPTSDPTPRFMWHSPEILVITNIDHDHPDVYPTLEDIQDAFIKLVAKVSVNGCIIANADDPISIDTLKGISSRVIWYGTNQKANVQIVKIKNTPGINTFTLQGLAQGTKDSFTLHIPGLHNIHNAAAAIITSHQIGLTAAHIQDGLAKFRGTKRRFEILKEADGVMYIDDYAHHPEEIEATIRGARQWYPGRRIIAIFQPHTYSRTKTLLPRFARSFHEADIAVITEIYASAREAPLPGVTGKLLSADTAKQKSNTLYVADEKDLLDKVKNIVKTGDIVLFMGAGSIYNWGRNIVSQL